MARLACTVSDDEGISSSPLQYGRFIFMQQKARSAAPRNATHDRHAQRNATQRRTRSTRQHIRRQDQQPTHSIYKNDIAPVVASMIHLTAHSPLLLITLLPAAPSLPVTRRSTRRWDCPSRATPLYMAQGYLSGWMNACTNHLLPLCLLMQSLYVSSHNTSSFPSCFLFTITPLFSFSFYFYLYSFELSCCSCVCSY